MTRHLKEAHKNEQDVARAVAAGGRVLQRTMLRLKNSGVFKQNVKTLQDGHGTLIVCRRSDNDHIVEDYTPCPYCYTFVIKTELYRHCASCAEKPDGGSSDRTLSATSATLLDAAVNTETAVNPDLREHILKKMRLDNVTATIKSDNLILAYGAAKYRKKGPRGYKYISSRMRLLGRLLIRMRSKEGNENKPLTDFVTPGSFDDIVAAVETEAGLRVTDDGQRGFKNPCFVTKVGHGVLKCCNIKRGIAIRDGDSVTTTVCDNFERLYRSEYSDSLSGPALTNIAQRKNHLSEFPDEEDFIRLRDFLKTKMDEKKASLREEASAAVWRDLAELVMTRLVVFNARRGGEAALLKLTAYAGRKHAQVQGLMERNMSPTEKNLLQRYDGFHLNTPV